MTASANSVRRYYNSEMSDMTLKNFHFEYPTWTIDAVKTGLHPGLGTFGVYLREFITKQDVRCCPEFFCDAGLCVFNIQAYEKFCQVLDTVDAEKVILCVKNTISNVLLTNTGQIFIIFNIEVITKIGIQGFFFSLVL